MNNCIKSEKNCWLWNSSTNHVLVKEIRASRRVALSSVFVQESPLLSDRCTTCVSVFTLRRKGVELTGSTQIASVYSSTHRDCQVAWLHSTTLETNTDFHLMMRPVKIKAWS